jgi:hypothetical protein
MKTIQVSGLPITVIRGYVENKGVPILRFVIDGEVIYMKNHRLASPTTIQGQEIHWLAAWVIMALNTVRYYLG